MSELTILKKEVQDKMKVPAEALMEILRNYGDPHMTIVIDQTSAKLLRDETCFVAKPPVD